MCRRTLDVFHSTMELFSVELLQLITIFWCLSGMNTRSSSSQRNNLPCDWWNEGEGRQRRVLSLCCHVGCSGCGSEVQGAGHHRPAHQTEGHRREQVRNIDSLMLLCFIGCLFDLNIGTETPQLSNDVTCCEHLDQCCVFFCEITNKAVQQQSVCKLL